MKILFFDYETTGFNGRGAYLREGGLIENFCRPVSLCYIVTDGRGDIITDRYEEIYPQDEKGNMFDIPKSAQAVHHITTEHALEFGVDCKMFHREFVKAIADADIIVAHNGTTYDRPIFVATCIRLGLVDKQIDNTECDAMPSSKLLDTMKHPDIKAWVDARNKKGHKKAPSMAEFYQKCFNDPIKDAHNARGDVKAMMDCFFYVLDNNIITLDDHV